MNRKLVVAFTFGADSAQIADFFSGHGYQVDIVDNAVDCLRDVRQLSPDALILDWDVPQGGGAGVLARLREGDVAINLPVVLLSDKLLGELDAEAPVARCVHRPCDIVSLYNAVESAVDSTDHSSDVAEFGSQ